jgi:hypothetical protein
LEIVAILLWLSSQLVWPVRPASAGLARSTCSSAPPVALEKGRRTDMDPFFPTYRALWRWKNTCTRGPNRHFATEATNFSDCSGAPAVPRWSPTRSAGRGCPTSPYQPNGRRESRRLGDHVGSANSTTQRELQIAALMAALTPAT